MSSGVNGSELLAVEGHKESEVISDLVVPSSQTPPEAAQLPVEPNEVDIKPDVLTLPTKTVLVESAPRCMNRSPRKYSFHGLSQDDLTQEILARAEKKRQNFPDAMDVLVALKSTSQIKIPTMTAPLPPPPPKLPKIRDDEKSLDAKDLLLILQDGGSDGLSPGVKSKLGKTRVPKPKFELNIDPELEKELALKQLMEFSRRKTKNTNNNVVGDKVKKDSKTEKGEGKEKESKPKKRSNALSNGPPSKRGPSRELRQLLQDEGAINMLYDVEKGDSAESKDRLSSKRRLKKVLKKKAQEVEAAILVATSSTSKNSRSLRASDKRKQSIESMETEGPQQAGQPQQDTGQKGEKGEKSGTQFSFAAPAEASKIIRRHSSSSSYSSRGSSPRRMSLDRDRSPSSSETSSTPTNSKNDIHSSHSSPRTDRKTSDTHNLHSSGLKLSGKSTSLPAAKISERTEKLIEMKVRELNLQPHHGAIIKQLIVEKKNGLKERLQSEFAVKFKAALPQENSQAQSTPESPGVILNTKALAHLKAKTKSLVSELDAKQTAPPSPVTKPAWKMVEEDWDSGDEDTDSRKTVKLDKRLKTSLDSDLNTLIARVKASKPQNANSTPRCAPKEGTIPQGSSNEHSEDKVRRTSTELASLAHYTRLPKSVPGPTPGSDVRLERMNAIIRLYIKPTTCRLPNSLDCKVMNELTQALDYLESSSDVRVIVLVFPPLHDAMSAISDSESDPDGRGDQGDFNAGFMSPADRSSQCLESAIPSDHVNHSNGVDLLALCVDSSEERRQASKDTASAIKDLTHKLATCSRLVCTAVSGKAIGLSVTLLAYCDFVLADETATFSTPYSQLGYLPEAAGAHTLPLVIGKRKASWLLLGNGTLSASEAEVCGLVSNVVPRRSLAHELNSLARSLASTSMLATGSTKGMMTNNIRPQLSNWLTIETNMLENHWSAPDTQHRMKNFAVQIILDAQQNQWKDRMSRTKEPEQIQMVGASVDQDQQILSVVPKEELVFQDPSDLNIEPLLPVDDLHFEDPATELQLAPPTGEYKLQQLS